MNFDEAPSSFRPWFDCLKYKARFFRSHIHQTTGAKKQKRDGITKSRMAQRVGSILSKKLLSLGEWGAGQGAQLSTVRGGERDEVEGCIGGDDCSRQEGAAGTEAAVGGWTMRRRRAAGARGGTRRLEHEAAHSHYRKYYYRMRLIRNDSF
jgi:hypothetical protein